MKLFLTFTRKGLIITICAVIAALVIISRVSALSSGNTDISTNALRVEYINGLGIKVNETAESTRSITIPTEFSDVYENYNRIQKKAGFDLTPYKGMKADVYSYILADDEYERVNLIIIKNKVIGGDISSVRADGQMRPLTANER